MSSGFEKVDLFQHASFGIEDFNRKASPKDLELKRTHIVCTMGPACGDVDTVVKMIDAGMNVCRFNFSHGDHAAHKKTLDIIHEAIKRRPDANLGLMLDTKGPEIRTGFLKDHTPIQLERGQKLKITTDYSFLGDNTRIACSYPLLATSVHAGDVVLIADGSITCKVLEVLVDEIEVEVMNSATLGERKNLNLPNVKVDLPILSEKDKDDILNFGVKYNMDFIALSFTQSAQDVHYTRQILGEHAKKIKIIPKIENMEGVINYDEILEASDGIMIARGDLGMEIDLAKVSLAQKWMTKKANIAAKPIITATQMLESMIKNPRPTRAEAADVGNAVLDGTDCVMLSGETAGGQYPVVCVEYMAKLCYEAENAFIQPMNLMLPSTTSNGEMVSTESISKAAVNLATDIGASLIICLTCSGNTARFISKYRPRCNIIALCLNRHVLKSLSLSRGVTPMLVNSFQDPNKIINETLQLAKQRGFCKSGAVAVSLFGLSANGNVPVSEILRIIKVD
ncbi:bifunctional Pyruvate kinase [Babesia duncani]|uniref:Pyruvate kinase n=1 Tax=Babesia duncani TaxID=323732 RepID=A0AAD9PKI2_9APIC|nr:bifunctional Pyruvate kinase [Babesia duncani]KAK2196529.1 bifunctional Pyruvate kinase [Babesia duncani]